jgi:DNA mismatch endonuclease (patch repair protein)
MVESALDFLNEEDLPSLPIALQVESLKMWSRLEAKRAAVEARLIAAFGACDGPAKAVPHDSTGAPPYPATIGHDLRVARESWISTHEGRHLAGRRKTNTEPELLLRRALHAAGRRFRLHRQIAARCTPDLVLPGPRVAVFVDGCWWHSCPVHGRKKPFTGPNAALWEAKMARIRERDKYATTLAENLGWTVVRLWECDITADPQAAASRVIGANSTK